MSESVLLSCGPHARRRSHPVLIPPLTGTEMTTDAICSLSLLNVKGQFIFCLSWKKKSNVTVAVYTWPVSKVSCLYLSLWDLAEHRAKKCLTEQNI